MKTLTRFLKLMLLPRLKTAHANKTLNMNQPGANAKLPRTFDFTAYFDDTELENNAEDTFAETRTSITDTKLFCLKNEKCTSNPYLSDSLQFECCTF
jgi:hypothetical protein